LAAINGILISLPPGTALPEEWARPKLYALSLHFVPAHFVLSGDSPATFAAEAEITIKCGGCQGWGLKPKPPIP
jgi:hypothetical protein